MLQAGAKAPLSQPGSLTYLLRVPVSIAPKMAQFLIWTPRIARRMMVNAAVLFRYCTISGRRRGLAWELENRRSADQLPTPLQALFPLIGVVRRSLKPEM